MTRCPLRSRPGDPGGKSKTLISRETEHYQTSGEGHGRKRCKQQGGRATGGDQGVLARRQGKAVVWTRAVEVDYYQQEIRRERTEIKKAVSPDTVAMKQRNIKHLETMLAKAKARKR